MIGPAGTAVCYWSVLGHQGELITVMDVSFKVVSDFEQGLEISFLGRRKCRLEKEREKTIQAFNLRGKEYQREVVQSEGLDLR